MPAPLFLLACLLSLHMAFFYTLLALLPDSLIVLTCVNYFQLCLVPLVFVIL